jgi:hypothetical protein
VARRGEVLESPINGQRAIFRETVQDTGGKLLRLGFLVAPGGGVLVDRQGSATLATLIAARTRP